MVFGCIMLVLVERRTMVERKAPAWLRSGDDLFYLYKVVHTERKAERLKEVIDKRTRYKALVYKELMSGCIGVYFCRK